MACNALLRSRDGRQLRKIVMFIIAEIAVERTEGMSMAVAPPSSVNVVNTIHTSADGNE